MVVEIWIETGSLFPGPLRADIGPGMRCLIGLPLLNFPTRVDPVLWSTSIILTPGPGSTRWVNLGSGRNFLPPTGQVDLILEPRSTWKRNL